MRVILSLKQRKEERKAFIYCFNKKLFVVWRD
ncbi:MAG: hypothetical protein ACFWT2_03760 [Thermoanaerobacterium thermosaccharolyticum]|jgi:hypothetical protein